MQTRTIALGLIAVLAAFAVAFGVGKAASGKTATAGVRASAIKVAPAPSVGNVEVGGTVPALKAKAKKKSPAKKKTTSDNTSTTAPSNSSTPAPSHPTSNPTPNPTPKPKPRSQPDPSGGGPVTGGNEDG